VLVLAMPILNQTSRMPRSFPVWAAISIVLASGVLAAWMLVRHLPAQALVKAFSDYAGSASCRECHREEYDQWAKSNHGLAEQGADSNTCQVAFAAAKTVGRAAQPVELAVRNGKYEVTTTGAGGQRETYVVDRVIGHDPLVQFLVGFPGGRWQALATAWDPGRKEWFEVFGAEERLPGEWGHWTGRGMNWNGMCAACHNTGLRKNYDPTTDTYHTAMAEMSVGCEACHGPLQSHVQWQHRSAKPGRKDPTLAPMSRQQKLDACGACHARRSELTGNFKPGDDLLDHFELAMVDGTDLYYPDGQVLEEDYEYASFLGSRMRASGVECTDCHQPHSAKPRLPGNFLCLRCHDGSYTNSPVIDPVAHSHHQVRGYGADGKLLDKDLTHYKPDGFKETGGECVNCHMPQTVYMQRHARHDHGLTIPDPLLSKEYGVPNACNRCHQDKDADWALAQVDKWYGKLMDRPTRQRARRLAEARAGNPAAVEPLLKILAAETNAYWEAALINVLPAWSAQPQVEAVLRQSLSDRHALVREKAARALDGSAENLTAPTTAALRARLEDPVRSVRIAAAWALRASLDPQSRAARELDLFLDTNADQPGGQLEKGEFFVARGEPQQALEHYRQAVAWDPASAPIRRDLAVLYGLLNQNHEALEQLREAVRLEPREAEYHYSLALALNDAGDLAKAVAELQEATRLNPRHADAWRNLGLARAAQEDLAGALDALGRAEDLAPGDPRLPYARATVLARLDRVAEARAAAARALELRPDYPEARELIQRLGAYRLHEGD
jgi:tetratricopeptide (TPR) repeat protein